MGSRYSLHSISEYDCTLLGVDLGDLPFSMLSPFLTVSLFLYGLDSIYVYALLVVDLVDLPFSTLSPFSPRLVSEYVCALLLVY